MRSRVCWEDVPLDGDSAACPLRADAAPPASSRRASCARWSARNLPRWTAGLRWTSRARRP